MSIFYELTALELNLIFTGTMGAPADRGQYGGFQIAYVQSLQTGSWFGLDNTFGAYDMSTVMSSSNNSVGPGHWWGIDISWGTYLIPTESVDRNNTTSNAFPSLDQGLSPGDWDPFPIPVPPPPPALPPRDLTRYRKSYSFGRNQPVRIRLVKP